MHGTNNITSSMGIAWNKQHHFKSQLLLSPWDAWNKQHHFFYGHCMEQATSLQESIIVSPWDAWNKQHHFKSQLL